MTDKYKKKAAGGKADRRTALNKFRKERRKKKIDEHSEASVAFHRKELEKKNPFLQRKLYKGSTIKNTTPVRQSQKVLRYLMLRHGKRCVYCGVGVHLPVYKAEPKATLDHLIPRSKGGSNEISNLVVACRECNGKKSDKMPGDYMREIWGEFLERCPHEINLKD